MPQRDRLGLRENPFKNNNDQRYFYADQNRAQILESTEHLIEYSSNFQVIIGESGVGKSYLLKTLSHRIDNNWRVATVNHSEQNAEQYDTLSLIQAILNAFGATDGSYSDLLEALETQLAEINQLGFKPVLMVDNAQTLSIDSLRFLIQLSQQKQNEEPYINIILFATDEITDFLQSSELRDYREFIHIATLSLFDKEGVSGYLRHKMAVVGFDRESPFTPRIIDSIFDNSKGLPEKINFFADKFLASSGKAENYIEPGFTDQKTKADSFNSVQEHEDLNPAASDNLTNFPIDDELQDHRSDRAAEQLSRLAEKFEEIEQLGDQPVDAFLSDQKQYNDELGSNNVTDDEPEENNFSAETSSVLPKFVIPVAVLGLLLVAVFVINGIFEKSEQIDPQLAGKEEIELLPLELPPQGEIVQNLDSQKAVLPTEETLPKTEMPVVSETIIDTPLIEKDSANQESVTELEIVEVNGSDSDIKESQVPVTPDAASKTDSVTLAAPVITQIEPEPVIGANSRQYITILGNNLEKDTSLIVSWANNKKVFSAKQTPEQWHYINNNKIKLHLSTGATSQQWQISAKSATGVQSQHIKFDVVRPFVSKMTIQHISPNPLIGSNKRQAVTIKGQGFSTQTVVELKWDKNKKHFSSRLTPGQFEFISANQIKLYIATGTKVRKWRILATNPSGSTSSSSFSVVSSSFSIDKERPEKASISSLHNGDALKGESWLRQQPDTNYTIQLFASHNKQAIDELLNKHALKGDILRFKTQKEGKNWYTMTYGSYVSKQDAIKSVASLDAKLATPAPWVRSMASIKETLLSESNQPGKKTLVKIPQKSRDEAWIWTQNPADHTVQLIALSSEQGIKDYIKQYSIQSEAVYFKTIRSDKALYVLLYGKYTNKKLATQAAEKLSGQINNGKPWVRSFSAVHEMMSSR